MIANIVAIVKAHVAAAGSTTRTSAYFLPVTMNGSGNEFCEITQGMTDSGRQVLFGEFAGTDFEREFFGNGGRPMTAADAATLLG